MKAEQAKTPMGIEEALTVYLTGHIENSAGYDWLQEFTYKALHDYGVGFYGSHSSSTNQRLVTIRHTNRTDEQIQRATDLLDAVAQFILPIPGAVLDRRQKEMVETKHFAVSPSDHGVRSAHQMPDGSWSLGLTQWGRFSFTVTGMTTLALIKALSTDDGDGDDE